MEFVLQRDRVVQTPFGHQLGFKKGVPLHVPFECHDIALAAGAEPVEALPEKGSKATEPSAEERAKQLLEAVVHLAEKNDSADFTAAGVPSVKAVSRVLGWSPSGDEVATAWTKHRQA